MAKIAEPNIDFTISQKKIVLKGKLKEECAKNIVISSNSFHELFIWNKNDPKGNEPFTTDLEIWSKFRKLDFPDILVQHKLKWRHLSSLSWWHSFPTNIKIILFFLTLVSIALLYTKLKNGWV